MERNLWAVLFFVVLMRFSAGTEVLGRSFGFSIVEQSASSVRMTYLVLGVLGLVAELIRIGVIRSLGTDLDVADEGDAAIDSKAKQVGYWVGIVAAHLFMIWAISAAYTTAARGAPTMLDFTSLTGLVFALLAVLFVQEVVRNVTARALYRR